MIERFIGLLLCYSWLYAFGLCSFGFAVKPEFREKYSWGYFLKTLCPFINVRMCHYIWCDEDGQYRI